MRYHVRIVGVFDKLEEFLRTMVEQTEGHTENTADPDYTDAWEELDEYMRFGEGRNTYGPYRNRATGTARARPGAGGRSRPVPPYLGEHFRNLELEFGAPLEEVQAAYKRLIRRYHPDRFGASPGKQRTATEIIKRVNASYHRILAFYRSRE